HAPERWMIGKQSMKGLLIHAEQVHFRDSSRRGHTRMVIHQSHLAEAFTRSDAAYQLDMLPRTFLHHFHFTVHDDVEPIATVALAEDDLAWLEMLSTQARSLLELKLDDIGRQHQVEEPVG